MQGPSRLGPLGISPLPPSSELAGRGLWWGQAALGVEGLNTCAGRDVVVSDGDCGQYLSGGGVGLGLECLQRCDGVGVAVGVIGGGEQVIFVCWEGDGVKAAAKLLDSGRGRHGMWLRLPL